MARGGGRGGRGGVGGRGGRASSARARAALSRIKRQRAGRNARFRAGRRKETEFELRNADLEFSKDIELGFSDLATLSPSQGPALRQLGRKLSNVFKNRYKMTPGERANSAKLAKMELRNRALSHMDSEFDQLGSIPVPGKEASVTKGGIYNGLQGGQRGLINNHARPAMMSEARRPGSNGNSIYNAGINSHPAASEAIGQTLRDLADGFQTMIDLGQTIINEATNSDSN